ncbi:unnamed protein product [Linum tenue]|uniref:Cellulose synthase n=1 Tax=Linum tenue TaxID=586396 RepID=A0AAV0IA95_9ROSI|nr:unnamed protein product [Linum tenue]
MSTFHLSFGEVTITLEDVVTLIGLAIDGDAVIVDIPDEEWSEICVRLLGQRAGRFAWGAAVLAYLYREMDLLQRRTFFPVSSDVTRHACVLVSLSPLGISGQLRIKPMKNVAGVCQICGDNIGKTVNGDPFVACDVCGLPVCRLCYEYERNHGTKAYPQCKTRYKRHKGSPAIAGDRDEYAAADADESASDINYSSEKQNQKQKMSEHMLSWAHWMGRGCRVTECGEFSAASPEHASMASPGHGNGKHIHTLSYAADADQSPNIRSAEQSREFPSRGLGNVAWKERVDGWKMKQEKTVVPMSSSQAPSERGVGDIDASTDILVDESLLNDEARQPLSRKVSISSSKINSYRMVIALRLIILCIFLHYRITNPVKNAFPLWLMSVICEIWFAISWILDQFPKWTPVNRETYLDRLALRYDREGEPSQLAAVDIFVSTVDPLKEPPLVTANTVLSILSVDYPVDKVSCYVSDDGAAMLTFEALSETAEFARKWVPFSKKYSIEPRAPEWYFAQKIDYLKDKVHPSFVKGRRAMKMNLRGLDGIQGPVYVGTGCVFNRTALYGYEPPLKPKRKRKVLCAGFDDEKSLLMSQMSLEKRFGQSAVFVASTLMENGGVPQSATPETLLKEAIHVISCGYEDKSDWGSEVNVASIFPYWLDLWLCDGRYPYRVQDACPWVAINLLHASPPSIQRVCTDQSVGLSEPSASMGLRIGGDPVQQALSHMIWVRWKAESAGEARIREHHDLSHHSNTSSHVLYAANGVCLFTNKFIIPQISNIASIWFISLFLSIFATGILEMRWSRVGIDEWWRNEQFWVIGGVSSHSAGFHFLSSVARTLIKYN